ncbi:MAG: hydroxymethylglutaryl-CoA lyase [Opitutaceae bacterium]|nr:hydroxymethylglutaryl-CoA lyase [Opitutaceae bacterium]
MTTPRPIQIYEVGPRDGLQAEATRVSTSDKIALIDMLSGSGLKMIEATSFVSPRWVPQLGDAAEVMSRICRKPGVAYPVLTPNLKGYEAAVAAGADHVAIFASASEGFSAKNINCSIDESLARFRDVAAAATRDGVKLRGYVSCAIACPYDGPTKPQQVADVVQKLVDLGCYEVSLGDTTGVGTAAHVKRLLDEVARRIDPRLLAVHYHDTYGQALANILASLDYDIATVDSSVGGLGGCPYAPGSAGNVATEDVLYLLDGLGIATGVDLRLVVEAAWQISDALGRKPRSKVARAYKSRT